MKKKKLRLCVSVILVTITMFLLLMSSFIAYYNEKTIISDYLNDYTPSYLIGNFQRSYINKFNEEKSFSIQSGKNIYEKIGNIQGNQSVLGFKINETISEDIEKNNYNLISGVTVFYLDHKSEKLSLNLKSGRMPQNSSEIVLTDYIAKEINVKIGDVVYYRQTPLNLVGVIKTDYIENSLDRKLIMGQIDEYLDYSLQYYYFVAIVDIGFKKTQLENNPSIYLPLSNFMLSGMESQYLDSSINILTYGTNEVVTSEDLIYGNLPSSMDEIIVSYQFATKYDLFESDILERKHYFLNIESTVYNECYSNYINLNKYFPNGVKIVGIISETSCFFDSAIDIYISQDLFQEIKEEYYKYFYYNGFMLNCSEVKNYSSVVEKAYLNNVGFNDPSIMKILEFKAVLVELKSIINFFLIIILLLTFIAIVNYITSSIKENSKNIGILQALGVSRTDVSIVFLLESWIVYFIATIISVVTSLSFLYYVNYWFNKGIPTTSYNIIIWNIPVSLGVFVMIFIFCIISSLYPIFKLTKKRPVEIIRANEQ